MSAPGLIDAIVADAGSFATFRRDLHAHPELAFEERRTRDRIEAALKSWGIPVERVGGTGLVGVVKNGEGSRAVGLRADIDALPVSETNAFPHASKHAGAMHACGHDGHTAMLLASAKYLSTHRNFHGTVYLVFQPGEETGKGAQRMIDDGLFERFPMEAIFGAHNWPGLPVGQFALRSGPMSASCNDFNITIRGKGTHAAMPHAGVDCVPVACQLVLALQTIVTRNQHPFESSVISATNIHVGEARNAIAESCEIQGTVRTFNMPTLDMIERRMRVIAEKTCEAFETSCEFEFNRICPATLNSPAETEFARGVLGSIVGEQNVVEFEPTMGAEDFSYFLLHKPGCYFVIGNGVGAHRVTGHGEGPCVLHNPTYDFNDALIPLGASAWVRMVEAWFASAEKRERA